jgi:hypothetical protein
MSTSPPGVCQFGKAMLLTTLVRAVQAVSWNKKRVRRVYCDMGLNLPRRGKTRLPERLRQPLNLAEEFNK